MNFFIAIFLGLVQGITEFLPISSSGHLVLFEHIFKVEMDYTFLNVILHFATLLAVCWFYRKKLVDIIKKPFSKTTLQLIIATIPAVVFVVLCNGFIEEKLSSLLFVGIGFLATAVLLFLGELFYKKTKQFYSINNKNSFLMGIAQAFAIFPGLSRSGTTLSFGLASGIKKDEALDFSFLMSVPIILGSLCYEIFAKNVNYMNYAPTDILFIILSFFVAFFAAILGIKFMQKIVNKMKLIYFIPYLIIIGIVSIVIS